MSEQQQKANQQASKTEQVNTQQPGQSNKQQEKVEKQIAAQEKQEQIPDKFYDSDLASVNEKDFLSDNEPPKDIIHERKLLHKQKQLHIYKTIVKVGTGIDKPAPFDEIRLRYKKQGKTCKQGIQQAKVVNFIEDCNYEVYNLGKKNEEIQRLVTSMKRGEIALFQIEELEVSKKSNIKVLKNKIVYVIEVDTWITAIDIDENKQVLKYMLRRGEGPFRVSKYDEISYELSISYKANEVFNKEYVNLKIEQQTIDQMQPLIWKVLCTMKKNELSQVKLSDQNLKILSKHAQHGDKQEDKVKNFEFHDLQKIAQSGQDKIVQKKNEIEEKQSLPEGIADDRVWKIKLQVKDLISIDDIFMDGSILKKLLIKGVSTAKPESSSIIYYALKFLNSQKKVLHQDACFNSDWWEDYGKLDVLGCRKNYMDEFKMSKFLKCSMKRMKPAEVSQLECRNIQFFKYGHDYQQLKNLWPKDQQFPPRKVTLIVRVYNFTEGKNCFNMSIEEKIEESRRKKIIAVKLLNEGKIQKAFKRFQNIVSFYNSGDIDQAAYDEKVSALMNSILCLMKQNKFVEMIPLCNVVLQKPRHGFNQDKMKLQAQGIKVEGNVKSAESEEMDSREAANLDQNQKILDKCLYRKGLALTKVGQSMQAIQFLGMIKQQTEEVKNLMNQAEKQLQNYEQKSKKIFKTMFGS